MEPKEAQKIIIDKIITSSAQSMFAICSNNNLIVPDAEILKKHTVLLLQEVYTELIVDINKANDAFLGSKTMNRSVLNTGIVYAGLQIAKAAIKEINPEYDTKQ